MVAQVRSKWDEIPDVWQRWMKIGAALAGALVVLGTGTRLDAVMGEDLTPRVQRVEASVARVEAVTDTIRAEAARDRAYIYTELDFMSCERKAANGMDGLTLEHCIDEYRKRTQPARTP